MLRRKILQVTLAMGAVALCLPHGVRGQQNYAVIAPDSVEMKTRDGVKLYANIYRPKGDGKIPVILMRAPYDKSTRRAGWPAYDRNLNAGAEQATSRDFIPATNTMLHDVEHPSALLLPVTTGVAVAAP